jgi:hypothetical protein
MQKVVAEQGPLSPHIRSALHRRRKAHRRARWNRPTRRLPIDVELHTIAYRLVIVRATATCAVPVFEPEWNR